jgi:predicted RNA binding protein YcfA (HicA-like mRNA interferase family)
VRRRDRIAHLLRHGYRFVREGGEHSVWENPANGRKTSIPRHRKIPEFTAIRISKQLEIPPPS